MIYGSVCTGISAEHVAWADLGWTAAWFSEIDPFCCALLKHHYPEVPNLGDMTDVEKFTGPIDVLVGGTPCQDFSVAGKRAGMAGERSGLALGYIELAKRLRPKWLVWENVFGVLSSVSHEAPDEVPPPDDLQPGQEWSHEEVYEADEGTDFGCFLAGLQECGYGLAWRVLDAQFAGVPQRRRRVFLVGYFGDWRRAYAVLSQSHSLSGNPPPSREAGERTASGVAGSLAASGAGSARPAGQGNELDILVNTAWDNQRFRLHDADGIAPTLATSDGGGGHRCPNVVARCLASREGMRQDAETENMVACIKGAAIGRKPEAGPQRGEIQEDGNCCTLSATEQHAICFEPGNLRRQCGSEPNENTAPTLGAEKTGDTFPHIAQAMAVRRLTPEECEKLQGHSPGYTLIPCRGKPACDSNRYRALGNGIAVPCLRWIGERIQLVEDMTQ